MLDAPEARTWGSSSGRRWRWPTAINNITCNSNDDNTNNTYTYDNDTYHMINH